MAERDNTFGGMMAALTVQNIVDAGTAPTYGAVTASDTAQIGNGTNTVAIYQNGSASPVTVTANVPGFLSYGPAYPAHAFTVAAGAAAWIPLRKAYDDGTGNATITTSAQTSVTVAVVRVS